MRSSWKPVYYSKSVLAYSRRPFDPKNAVLPPPLKVYDKSSVIPGFLEGRRVLLHNGKRFISFLVRDVHVGSRFGQLLSTKVGGAAIHKSSKKTAKKTAKR